MNTYTYPEKGTTCPFCGRLAESPFKEAVDGRIVNCCVGIVHDAYVVRASNHSAFVARARKAGITGRWND